LDGKLWLIQFHERRRGRKKQPDLKVFFGKKLNIKLNEKKKLFSHAALLPTKSNTTLFI
jgi:hypothetical protein